MNNGSMNMTEKSMIRFCSCAFMLYQGRSSSQLTAPPGVICGRQGQNCLAQIRSTTSGFKLVVVELPVC